MSELKWDKTDFLVCPGVLPEVDDYETLFSYQVERDGLILSISLVPYESIVELQLRRQDRAISTALPASGRRLVVVRSCVLCCLSCTESIGSATLMTSSANPLPAADIIVDEFPNSGVFNMSMDAALLQIAAEKGRSTVRIYQWSEPTITVGYFQGLTRAIKDTYSFNYCGCRSN